MVHQTSGSEGEASDAVAAAPTGLISHSKHMMFQRKTERTCGSTPKNERNNLNT